MTRRLAPALRRWMALGDPVVRIVVERALGSTPRDSGAAMLVTARETRGTIGGGRLELDAVDAARDMLARGEALRRWDVALGPAIGQCCGGHVRLKAEIADQNVIAEVDAAEAAALPLILLFGAGHVGRALAQALAPLPFRLRWVDERPDEFGPMIPDDVEVRVSSAWEREITEAPAGSACIIVTHSHALDSLIGAAALERGDFGYVGLIGSRTKRRSFERAFREIGIPRARIETLVCPIGERGVRDKRPEVIAALTAAEIIEVFSHRSAQAPALPQGNGEEWVHEHSNRGPVRQSA